MKGPGPRLLAAAAAGWIALQASAGEAMDPIDDLAAIRIDGNSVLLEWTSPAGVPLTPFQRKYFEVHVRYAPWDPCLSPDEWWDLASEWPVMPQAEPAGAVQSMVLPGLAGRLRYWLMVRILDDKSCEWSGPSNAVVFETDPGPPAAPELVAGPVGPRSVTLEWGAPSDDAGDPFSGPVAGYDLRWSVAGPIDSDEAFASATPWAAAFAPGRPGSVERLVVGGLLPHTVYHFCLKAVDDVGGWSGRSPDLRVATADDPVPPGDAVLLVTATSRDSVTLEWLAPADDGFDAASGRAWEYDLRYSASGPIGTEEDFAAAARAEYPSVPGEPGTPETATVRGLPRGAVFHFCLRTRDFQPNWSALSNSPGAAAELMGSRGGSSPCQGAAPARGGLPAAVILLPLAALLRRIP